MTDTRDSGSPNELSPSDELEHREAAKKINGKYANQVYIQPLAEGMIRVNFGERVDENPSYHTAIILTPANCLLFSELMARMANALLNPAPIVTPSAPAESGHGRE